MNKEKILEIAKECDFQSHAIHGGLIVRHSNGSWIDIQDKLEAFANRIMQECGNGEVVAYMSSKDISLCQISYQSVPK